MADRRKLQGEIDRCHKKVQEGVEIFEDIWQKAHNAPNINQKEKYEGDLKKEIKKLQRLRDQIKTWIASSEIKDKRVLIDDRKLIETQMERFKVLERETKTKAYSKEGLGAALKLDPAQREKEELCNWITSSIESLNIQIDQFESEIESISVHLRKKKNDKDKQERIEKLKTSVDKHKYHINQLETLMRMLDNSTIDVNQVKGIKDDVDYYVESSQDPDFEENEFIYEDLELEDITEFLNKSKLNNAKDNPLNNNQQSSSFDSNKTSNSLTNNISVGQNDEEGTNSLQSTAHTSPSISPAPSPGLLLPNPLQSQPLFNSNSSLATCSTINKSIENHQNELNFNLNNLEHNNKDHKTSSDQQLTNSCTASLNSSSLINNSSTFNTNNKSNSVWSQNNTTSTSTTNSTHTSVSSTSLNTSNNFTTSLSLLDNTSSNSININSNNNEQQQSNLIGSGLTQEQQSTNNDSSANFIKQQNKFGNPTTLYAAAAAAAANHHQLNSASPLAKQLKNLDNNSSIDSNNSTLTQQQKSTSPEILPNNAVCLPPFTTSDSIIQQQQQKFKSSQLSPQLVNVNAADLYHQAAIQQANSSTLTSSAWNSIVNSRTSTTTPNQLLNGLNNDTEQQKLTSLKSMALQAIDSARIDHNNQSVNSQQQNQDNSDILQQLQTKQQQLNHHQTSANQLYDNSTNQQPQSNASIMNLLGANNNTITSTASTIKQNLVLQNNNNLQTAISVNNQQQSNKQAQQQQAQQHTTNEAHISPMLGVAPLGPISLTKPMIYQMHMLESASRHIIHPMDSQRTRTYLPPSSFPTPSYYPQQALPKSDTLEFFDRLSTETLFFVFYFMEGTKAQFLAAKTLKKQSWRFHTKFMMWFQRHEEPKAITDEYEQGTYIYFDYEKWGQRKKEHFTFEYRYLEDRELN